ncbi:hypothetical protein [Amycolatopsis ultiminotia]|uniref:hypothetical protein n=1 Tax=Amycolatopsis ultiminotia TaxID=543629 RepID=UPI0031F062AF
MPDRVQAVARAPERAIRDEYQGKYGEGHDLAKVGTAQGRQLGRTAGVAISATASVAG